jgi:hypothetical protein
MKNLEVIVSVDLDAGIAFGEVAQAVERAGLNVHPHGRSEGLGFLSGVIAADAVHKLRAVKGVLGVETARTTKPIPPDSNIQ